jgi:threonine aldolase
MNSIDMRSDTVTWPTEAMRAAMAQAEVGDDVYGDDPTVNKLQAMAAEHSGKDAALFVPSGTMGNLIAFLVHCQRGDEAILGDLAHPFLYEGGGMAALGGVQPRTLPTMEDGTLALEDIEAAIRGDDPHYPITRLIALENTHNRRNGAPLSKAYTDTVGELAKRHNLKLHIDGARIFNAAVALDTPLADLVAAADSVTFCLSKGLCAPVGSLLCGSEEFIAKALRLRKQLGGGMRQAGVLAAAGIIALDEMVDRLAEDHERAARLAESLAAFNALSVPAPHTNIVRFELKRDAGITGEDLLAGLAAEGVKVGMGGPWGFRAVTHYWIDDTALDKALAAFSKVLSGLGPAKGAAETAMI